MDIKSSLESQVEQLNKVLLWAAKESIPRRRVDHQEIRAFLETTMDKVKQQKLKSESHIFGI